MRIFAIDDEKLALEALLSAIHKAVPKSEVYGFRNPSDLLEKLDEIVPDIVFLDVEMKKMNGVELAEEIKKRVSGINLIFASGFSKYTKDAFTVHASGYVMKPVTAEKIKNEISNLRFPIAKEEKVLEIQTFGNFEVFVENAPLPLKYNKSKELLAYLIDRNGALCSNKEIISVLWENDFDSNQHVSYLKNLRADLVGALENCGFSDVLVRAWGKIGIQKEGLSCDYYKWLEGDKEAYRGEYMSQYSWAEYTNAMLMDDYQKRFK
nr:response regulator [uncultured Catonella sp.]